MSLLWIQSPVNTLLGKQVPGEGFLWEFCGQGEVLLTVVAEPVSLCTVNAPVQGCLGSPTNPEKVAF